MNLQNIVLALAALAVAAGLRADEIQVAVASNFAAPAKRIAAEFERSTGHKAHLSFGATGKFYAQIANGAPFDVLLAADDETPARLVREGLARSGSQTPYAVGRLILWSPRPDRVDGSGDILRRGDFARLALANPKTAPYGAAAIEAMTSLGLLPALQGKFVLGENIAQAYQFVASGNADLGFIALSQVWANGQLTQGSGWIVPADLHQPIRQDAVVLTRTAVPAAASALLAYLKGDRARAVIKTYGYQ